MQIKKFQNILKFKILLIILQVYKLKCIFNEVWDVSWSSIWKLVEDWTTDEVTANELLEYKDSRRVSISKNKEEKKEEE